MLMGATVFEIAGGVRLDSHLVKGVGTKRLGKGRVKIRFKILVLVARGTILLPSGSIFSLTFPF